MKRFASLLLIAFMLSSYIKCQTVDSIKVEQAGDFVKIRYKLLNSNSDQIYRVKVLCSINGGMNSEIRSITGDVGDQVIGGKSEYWVVWDVLKDVDEVKSVDFSVRAELIKDNSPKDNKRTKALSDRRLNVMLALGGPPLGQKGPAKFGGKIGYLGSWGITGMYLRGEEGGGVFSAGFDLTKRIVNGKTFNMHLSAGLNISKIEAYSGDGGTYSEWFTVRKGPEVGYTISIKRLTTSFSLAFFGNDGAIHFKGNKFGFIGLGYRF
jgi:hypothetical protein